MGIELVPAVVAPKRFQAHQRFIPLHRPELAGTFEPTLILAAGGFNGAGAQGLVGFEALLRRGCALVTGFAGFDDLAVFHAVFVIFKVLDLGLNFFAERFFQSGLKITQGGDDRSALVAAQLLEQGSDPLARLGRALSVEFMGDSPEMFFAMVKVQNAAGPRRSGLGRRSKSTPLHRR